MKKKVRNKREDNRKIKRGEMAARVKVAVKVWSHCLMKNSLDLHVELPPHLTVGKGRRTKTGKKTRKRPA